jgi:hypothetical protein
MRLAIAILEDNDDRIRIMRDCLADKFPFFELRFFRSAPAAIDWMDKNLAQAICIALDHDLEPAPGQAEGFDPGTGREVADFLATRRPSCPIIVHTSNVPAAIGMEMALAESGWSVTRVLPYDDVRWIAADWLPAMRDAVVQAAATAHSPSVGS